MNPAVPVGIDIPRHPLRRLNLEQHPIGCQVLRSWKVGQAADENHHVQGSCSGRRFTSQAEHVNNGNLIHWRWK